MEFSVAQKKAIYTGGASLLVSAAAGSGKTAVLVERVIQKVLSGGDISRLWIMTFTEAAATEMRQKIERAVQDQLEAQPENAHLQQQMLLLPAANISTVHAVCKRIIDRNFQLIGLDPSVNIGDESVLGIMFERLLEELVEQLYARAATDERLAEMIAFFSGGRNDQKLFETLRTAYKLYEDQPFPQTEFTPVEDIFAILTGDLLYRQISAKLQEALLQYDIILNDTSLAPLAESKLLVALESEREALVLALDACKRRDFDGMYDQLHGLKLCSWSVRGKVYEPFKEQLALCANYRVYAKELVQSLQSAIFHKDRAAHLADSAICARILSTLFAVVRELDESFTAAKRDRSMISFADMERLAVGLLVESYDAETDTLCPGAVALSMREQIDEIIVDEYQDTNRKQDMIFRALSDDGKNMFMVGDVKQSIYRFRAAAPELFLEKKAMAVPAEAEQITQPSFLYLNQNYRSHPDILRFANQIFRVAMSSRLGQIEYDETERLNTGGLYPEESCGTVELALMESGELSSEEFEELTGLEQQADYVAEKILALRGTPFYDVKQHRERPLEYGDMAILCRVAKNTAVHFENALQRRGIHCVNNNQDQQFLDLWEVKMLRAFLQVISNPYRDIPLVTLLYSDFYCFSARDLAEIRAADKYTTFYDALKKRALVDGASAAFLEEMEALRRAAVGRRTDEVLQMIFARTHILERIASYPDGGVRVANMQLMLRYAAEYERDSYKGLFSFLNYLDKMSALNKILPGARGGEDAGQCVQVLSVHKSKGLEYPVCFLVGLEKGMQDKDSRNSIIFNSEFGPALKMRRDADFTEYPSLAFNLLKENNAREALSEEMRILYVALTRPKTHLYLVTALKDAEAARLLENVALYQGDHPSEFLASSPSILKWLLYALRDQQSLQPLYDRYHVPVTPQNTDCRFDVVFCNELGQTTRQKQYKQRLQGNLQRAMQLATTEYAYAAQTKLPIKLSVSEVKGLREQDPEALPLIPHSFGRRTPSFLSGQVTGNTVGNAVHKFMQFADFRTLAAPDGFAKEKQRLAESAFLTEGELALVPQAAIDRFVAQPLFEEMIASDSLQKEKRFFFTLPACEIFADCSQKDPVLLQGVLDCCYEKDGQLIIVDYKTDRLQGEAQFVERYGLQLELYRYGMQQLTGKNASKLYIYSFHLDKVIEIS